MIIRKATLQDAEAVADCMLLAMKDIVYAFIGKKDREKAKSFLKFFVEQPDNQYSYLNCWVAEVETEVVAAANLYDGADLYKLRQPIIQILKNQYQQNIELDDETQAGEIYLDSIGVHPARQGTGIGTVLLQFLIDIFVRKENQTLGLLVDENNSIAKEFYLKLGFEIIGEKKLVGKKLHHLQIHPRRN